MADRILMPKLGNSVETCLIVEWLKIEGDSIAEGDVICAVETDKAAVDVEATATGVLLKILYPEGEEVPVLKPIAIVGEAGEDVSTFMAEEPDSINSEASNETSVDMDPVVVEAKNSADTPVMSGLVSPRARNLAFAKGIDIAGISGTGPSDRLIERDVLDLLGDQATATPAAIDKMLKSGGSRPAVGTGIGGRIILSDIGKNQQISGTQQVSESSNLTGSDSKEVSVKGVRKIISNLMLKSMTTTAQLTLNSSANAENLLALRKRLKASSELLGLDRVSLNDLIMFAVVRTLKDYPEINAHFLGDRIFQYVNINLGIAVDTERGLMVPVVKDVQNLTLREFASRTSAVYDRIKGNKILPDELSGATFTITNLGSLGIESFTPILNVPEVAILGVCTIQPKPVFRGDEVIHIPHIGLSLTFNHQALDGAPAAKFLHRLTKNIKDIDLLLAL